MKINKDLKKLTRKYDATLIRWKTHFIFELPSGKRVRVSKTPSCRFFLKKVEKDFKNAA